MGQAVRNLALSGATSEEKERIVRSQQALSKFFEKQSAKEKARQFTDRFFEMMRERIGSDIPIKDCDLDHAEGVLNFLEAMQDLGY